MIRHAEEGCVFIRIDDAVFNTVSFGEGTATIVAHGGWTGPWELWQQPFELLSRSHRCVAFDHRGAGATVADPASIDADRLVEDLIALLDHLHIEQCILAAESMGTLIALLAAQRHPERFSGLVLVSAMPAITPEATHHLVTGSRRDYPATVAAFVDACLPEPDTTHLARWGRSLLLQAEPEAAARLLEGCYGVVPDLTAIGVPCLTIHGEDDAIVPVSVAREVTAALADAELHVIEKAGHVPTVTFPEAVAELIDRWIADRIA